MEFPFLTPDEAFLLAAEADPGLERESFLEQVRSYIAQGALLASGIRFQEKRMSTVIAPTPPFELFSVPMVQKFASRERVEIPPLAMADYSGPGYDGRIVRDAGTDIDGWDDVRLHAGDVKRQWLRAAARAIIEISAPPALATNAAGSSNKPKPTNPALRQWMRDRVASWPNNELMPSEKDDLNAAKQHFAGGLSREEFRIVRRSETPTEWRKQGPRKALLGQVKD